MIKNNYFYVVHIHINTQSSTFWNYFYFMLRFDKMHIEIYISSKN